MMTELTELKAIRSLLKKILKVLLIPYRDFEKIPEEVK